MLGLNVDKRHLLFQMLLKEVSLCCQRETRSSPTYQGHPQPGKNHLFFSSLDFFSGGVFDSAAADHDDNNSDKIFDYSDRDSNDHIDHDYNDHDYDDTDYDDNDYDDHDNNVIQ